MACNKLLQEAFNGIETSYKLNTVIDDLPSSASFSANTIGAYLTKKGVSPKEVKASGILDMYKGDFKFTAKEWQEGFAKTGNKHHMSTSDVTKIGIDHGYDDVTLGTKGRDNPTYKETMLQSKAKPGDPTNVRHYNSVNTSMKSNIGWRRTHEDTINGKPTTVLNEFQSDWAQSERSGAAIFNSNVMPLKQVTELQKELKNLDKEIKSLIEVKKATPSPEVSKQLDDMQKDYMSKQVKLDKSLNLDSIVNDFPMTPKKHHQFQIVSAIDEAIKNGTNRVAIPIQRENELVGTEGVTKFYDSLNQSILPDIKKKLEKQGLRLKLGKEDYAGKPIKEDNILDFVADIMGSYFNSETEKKVSIIFNSSSTKDQLVKEGYDLGLIEMVEKGKKMLSKSNQLHVIEIEHIPGTKVSWDIYSVLGGIGLTGLADKLKEQENVQSE